MGGRKRLRWYHPDRGSRTQNIDLNEFGREVIASTKEFLVTIFPEMDYWPSCALLKKKNGFISINCESTSFLDETGVWWAKAVGVDLADSNGAGIRIGVVDVNIRNDTGPLAGIKNLGHATKLDNFDGDTRHGSFVVSFLVGDSKDCTIPGFCPSAEYFFMSAADADGNLSPTAVSDAIEILSDEFKCDIILVSAGDAEKPKEDIREAVVEARNVGTICLFAAGNEPGELKYPARYPEVIAVGALGKIGVLPENSYMRFIYESENSICLDISRNMYISGNLSFGKEIDFLAPGIGLLADIGDGHIHTVSGTSFAAPVAAGALAIALARDGEYARCSGYTRYERALRVLEDSIQGRMFPGLPQIGCINVTCSSEEELSEREKR